MNNKELEKMKNERKRFDYYYAMNVGEMIDKSKMLDDMMTFLEEKNLKDVIFYVKNFKYKLEKAKQKLQKEKLDIMHLLIIIELLESNNISDDEFYIRFKEWIHNKINIF